MRITIEMTEAERKSTTMRPGVGEHVHRSDAAAAEEAPAQDGGPPSEALLIALGAKPLTEDVRRAGDPSGPSRLGTDAGEAPAWLVDVIEGGADRSG